MYFTTFLRRSGSETDFGKVIGSLKTQVTGLWALGPSPLWKPNYIKHHLLTCQHFWRNRSENHSSRTPLPTLSLGPSLSSGYCRLRQPEPLPATNKSSIPTCYATPTPPLSCSALVTHPPEPSISLNRFNHAHVLDRPIEEIERNQKLKGESRRPATTHGGCGDT
ncbi:hypothetical protein HanIR_Chr10g0462771 [Helianthus annuus]|nr:hypothetical protein HanIR_Chr10g0462771 [Helianthus annuus]